MAKQKQPTDPRPPAEASPPSAGQPSAPPAPAGQQGAAQKRARQRAGRQAAAGRPEAPRPATARRSEPAETARRVEPAGTAGRAEPPDTVRYAVWLMYGGAAISALALIATVVTTGQARSLLHAAQPQLSAAQVTSAVHSGIISSVAVWIVTITLWLVMARTNLAGRGWARIVGTVLCVASTLSFVGYITQAYPPALKVIAVPLWLAGVAATVLLWRPATTGYIRSARV
jgi:hypothetical protein